MPNGVNLVSTDTRPIKVTKLAQNDTKVSRDSELAKSHENAGKVTAVVAVMTVFCKKLKNSIALSHKKGAHAIIKGISTKSV